MNHRPLICFIAIGALMATATACSGAPEGTTQPGQAVQLVFRQFDPADQVEGLVTAVDKWNTENPGIQVELETVSPNNPQQFAREANSGSGPDVIHIALADAGFLAEDSILTPLDDLMASDPVEGSDQWLATEMTVIDDTTWAAPWTADTMALVYRPDVLEKAGVESTPATWDDLKVAAAAIKESSGGTTSGFCFAAGAQQAAAQWFAINYYLWNHGQSLIQKTGEDWAPGVTKDDLVAAIDYFNGFFQEGYTPKAMQSITDYSDPSITSGLDSGTCAMAFMPPSAFRSVVAQTDAELLTAPMPGGLVDGSTHLGGRALGINANSQHQAEAWKFIKYLLSADTFDTYSQYPASAKTLTELEAPENEKGFIDQLPHSVPFYKHVGAPITNATLQELVNQQFSAVYSGQSDSKTAAQTIIDSINRGLNG